MEEKIDEIMQVAMPWQTRYERIQNGTLSQGEPCNDAASELVKATGAKIYKIKSGEFKTYFAINTNCVKLADYITGSAGLLDDMFERRNTIVVSKTIYRN